jgi:hypothetical protein
MRPSRRKAIAVAATVTIVVAVGLTAFLYRTFADMCGNETLAESISPDGTKRLIVFLRDCGATTGFSTQASLIATNATLPKRSGNIFIADTDHGSAPSGIGGGPELRAHWEAPNRLVLQHHSKAHVFKAERRIKDVDIRYETFR